MAKGRNVQPRPPRLSPGEMKVAIARFRRRIGDLEGFSPAGVASFSDPKVESLQIAIDEALSEAFGHGTTEYYRYDSAADLDGAGIRFDDEASMDIIQSLTLGKKRAIELLNQAIRSFEEKLADLGEGTTSAGFDQGPEPTMSGKSKDVFIVHGHDDLAKTTVARVVELAGLNAVILHEQANAGRTIIEKFEDLGASAGFAVVVLTPDDVGGPSPTELRPRARQNVIGEMFWFAGKLGRNHVCALKKGDLELPSDFAGVGFTDMDPGGAWKSQLLKELEAAGYEVDWPKALK